MLVKPAPQQNMPREENTSARADSNEYILPSQNIINLINDLWSFFIRSWISLRAIRSMLLSPRLQMWLNSESAERAFEALCRTRTFLRHRSLNVVTARNKVTIVTWASNEYRLTSIVLIADCAACTLFSSMCFIFSQSRRYNDSTARQQLPYRQYYY